MANTNKVTKREVINELLREELIQSTPMYKDYLEHELELLDNKKKSSKDKEEDIQVLEMLISEMKKLEETGKNHYTITELMKSSEDIQNYVFEDGKVLSNSKITSLLRSEMSKENSRVVNIKDKKNSYYLLAK